MVKLSGHASAEQLLTKTSYQVHRGSMFITRARAGMIYVLHISVLFSWCQLPSASARFLLYLLLHTHTLTFPVVVLMQCT